MKAMGGKSIYSMDEKMVEERDNMDEEGIAQGARGRGLSRYLYLLGATIVFSIAAGAWALSVSARLSYLEVVTYDLENFASNLTVVQGPQGEQGPMGPPGLSPDVGAIATLLAENYADVLRGADGVDGQPGAPGPAVLGMVIASTVACTELPGQWEAFEPAGGRFIVGNDGRQEWRVQLDGAVPIYVTGGESEVTLVTENMPPHSHPFDGPDSDQVPRFEGHGEWNGEAVNFAVATGGGGSDFSDGVGYISAWLTVGETGGGQPHNNMPPYIALYWCTPYGG